MSGDQKTQAAVGLVLGTIFCGAAFRGADVSMAFALLMLTFGGALFYAGLSALK